MDAATVKIILGYIVFFGYMLLVMVLGEAIGKKFNIDKEICRKCEHIATGASWLIACIFTGVSIHTFIINLVGLIVLAVVTFAGLMKTVERDADDNKKSYGLLYFGLSTLIVFSIAYFFDPMLYMYTGISYYCMVLGDGLAPLVARALKKKNPKVLGKKSLFGALTVFTFSSLSALVFNLVVPWMDLSPLLIISIGCLAATVELFSANCTDNLTVEFAVFGYLALNHYGMVTEAVEIALIAAFAMLLINGMTGALTYSANLFSWIYFIFSAFAVGSEMTTSILGMYILSLMVGVITIKVSNKKKGEREKLSRGIKQIAANSLSAIVMTVIFIFTHNRIFVLAAYAVIVEEFADSMASDIGKLSKKQPRDILTFKHTTAGNSGGITLLGSSAAVIGAAAAMLIPFSFGNMRLIDYAVLIPIAMLGVLCDSVLGSKIQVLYKCQVCGCDTERLTHCDKPSEYKKGIRIIDNSAVNLLSSVFTAVAAIVYLILV